MTRCINETCTATATIHTPVSLCAPCAIETALAVLPLALANALTDTRETAVVEPETVEPTDRERAAITALRVTNSPITRRTVAQAIRSIGGTCSTDRANALSSWARSGSDLALFDTSTD